MGTGTGGEGGTGSPGAPQPADKKKMEKRKWKTEKRCAGSFVMDSRVPLLFSIFQFQELQNLAAQILVLDDIRELLGNVGGVHLYVLFLQVGRFERNFVENLFENGVQAPRADIFCLLVHACGKSRDGGDGIFGNVQLHAFGLQERHVLLDERVLRLGENANEIFFLQGLQFDANGQAALQFRDQIGRLGDVERTSSDEKNMVGSNHPVAGVDGRAFDDRQNVALHAFARYIGPVAGFAAGNLVDLVDKNNSHLLGALVGHAHFPLLLLLAEHAGEHVLDIDVHLLDALVGDDFERGHGAFADFDIHHPLIQLAFAKLRAKFLPRALVLLALRGGFGFWSAGRRGRRRRKQEIEHAFFRSLFGAVGDFIELFLADHVDGGFHEIADHRFHIAPDVTDFGVLGSFDFDKRAARKARETPGNLRLSDARGADHENVLRQNILGDLRRKLLAADAIAQRHGYGTLGRGLPHDVLVELQNDLARRHVVERGEEFFSLDRRRAITARREDQFFFRLGGHELLNSFAAQKQFAVFSRLTPRALPL